MPRLGHRPSIEAGLARRLQILNFVRSYSATYGWAPSYREIAAAIGVTSLETVHRQLALMSRDGLIKHEPSLSRAIQVLT
jgi:repressor LexA